MSDIFFTGINSGIDWNQILDKVMEIKSKNLNEIKIKNKIKTEEKNFWLNLNVKFLTFIDTLNKLRKVGDDIFQSKEIINSNKNVVNFEVIDKNSIINNNYTIEVKSIATKAQVIGKKLYTGEDSVNKPAEIKSESNINSNENIDANVKILLQLGKFDIIPEEQGVIVINNKEIGWSNHDSLNEIVAKINSSIAGVWAHFDESSQTIILKSIIDGRNSKIQISQRYGNLLEVFKLNEGIYFGSDAVKTSIDKKLNEDLNLDIDVTSGYFSINGTKIYVDIQNDTIKSILNKINNSNASVLAYYDNINNSINLLQKNTGYNNKIILGDINDTSNFLYAIKLSENNPPIGQLQDIYYGKNSVISLNSEQDFISSSNEIKNLIPGVSINILSAGVANLKIQNDYNKIKNSINEIVNNFNNLLEEINRKLNEKKSSNDKDINEIAKGNMKRNSTLTLIKNRLINAIIKNYNIFNSDIKNLEEIGIKIEYYNNFSDLKLIFDENKFIQKLNSNFENVYNFFIANEGIVQELYSQLNNFISANGLVNSEIKEVNNILSQNNIRMAEINERLKNEREILQKKFTQMEMAMVSMQNQLAKLLNFQNR